MRSTFEPTPEVPIGTVEESNEPEPTQAEPAAPDDGSRWFLVTAERFDFSPKSRVTQAFKRDMVGFGTRALIARGREIGAIEVLPGPPEGYRVDKAGKVIRDA